MPLFRTFAMIHCYFFFNQIENDIFIAFIAFGIQSVRDDVRHVFLHLITLNGKTSNCRYTPNQRTDCWSQLAHNFVDLIIAVAHNWIYSTLESSIHDDSRKRRGMLFAAYALCCVCQFNDANSEFRLFRTCMSGIRALILNLAFFYSYTHCLSFQLFYVHSA